MKVTISKDLKPLWNVAPGMEREVKDCSQILRL